MAHGLVAGLAQVGAHQRRLGPGQQAPAHEAGGRGQAQGAGEHVRRSARQHAEGGVGPGDPGGHLVEGSVAAVPDHDIDALGGRVLRESGGVASPIRLDHGHLMIAGQFAMDHDGVAGRHGRRERVDHEQDPHEEPTLAPPTKVTARGCRPIGHARTDR